MRRFTRRLNHWLPVGVLAVVLGGLLATAAGPASASVSRAVPSVPGAMSHGVLVDVSCLPSRWCMAVGHGDSQKEPAVAWLWQHGTWRQLANPPGFGLEGVSCSARTFCMADVTGGFYEAVQWNGTTWSVVTPPPSNVITAPTCASSDLCAVINGVGFDRSGSIAEVWDGHAWKSWRDSGSCFHQALPCEASDVSCASVSACLTVGSGLTADDNLKPDATVWDGTDWHITIPPRQGSYSDLRSVSCTGTFCLVIGDTTTTTAYVASYNLSTGSWKNLTSAAHLPWHADICGGACFVPGGLSCASSTNCMSASRAGFFAWNGHDFRRTHPVSAGRGSRLTSVSCVKTFCMAVGYRTVNHVRTPLSELWNGKTWKILRQA